ncbi:hem peroxidase [Dillenia turbinata]|uniref:Peroxidase n=1 Tax=Dillenia turbinata TaxID=194707 RepID=A0AAN8UXV5_9MAGN
MHLDEEQILKWHIPFGSVMAIKTRPINKYPLCKKSSFVHSSDFSTKRATYQPGWSPPNKANMSTVGYVGIVILSVLGLLGTAQADLKLNYYAKSCPKAEKIVLDFVNQHIHNAPSLAAALIRMHFHDCFVRGCDGSVLINSTSSNQAEKDAAPNLTIRGFSFIDRVKNLLEVECPGIVSCADIIALVARDSIVATGGPFWNVPTGRRDGLISNASEALTNIPAPTSNFSILISLFGNKGLDLKDLILLSGAHTIGVGHCSSFSSRLYNFTGKGDQDPSLDSEYAANLKSKKCKSINDNTTIVEMDPGSFRTFDLSYYKLVLKRRGLFQSDAALITDSASKAMITQIVESSEEEFYAEFAKSMEKMGRVGIITGSSGEVRKHCALVNG